MIDCAVKHDVPPGRLYPESDKPQRSPFFRDGDRIIHTSAFRRLIGKTQVFIKPENDHVRNRLTHTIEVSRVSRQIATMLGCNPELAEAISLVHDLGHPPFGHLGETILNDILHEEGGFDHNVQALRIVTLLENPYRNFKGLNLSWFCLEGIIKHNGPLTSQIPSYIQEYDARHNLKLDRYPSCEAQIASLSDDITYNCHDLQDGLRAELFTFEDMIKIPLVAYFHEKKQGQDPTAKGVQLNLEIIRNIFDYFVMDLKQTSKKRLLNADLKSSEEVGTYSDNIITFSKEALGELNSIRKFLWKHMYQSQGILRGEDSPKKIIDGVFDFFMANPDELPDTWKWKLQADQEQKARTIGDYISGMTEKFVIDTYRDKAI